VGAHRSMTFVGDTDPLVAFNSWVFRDDGRLCFVWNSGLVGLKRILSSVMLSSQALTIELSEPA